MPRRDTLAALLLAAALVLAFALNRDQPLVRNSLVYARAAENVIARGFDPRPVVADSRLSYDKPIAFSWLASPFVAALGNHHGLMAVSLLGALAMLAAALHLLRTALPGPGAERTRALALLLGLLSPLAVYQGWSAHPDGIETALVLSSFAQTWRLAAEPDRAPLRRCALLAATIEAGALFKNYGLVLLPALPLAFAPRLLACWRAGHRRLFAGALGAWLLVSASTALALCGLHPLQRIAGEGGGAEQYGRGDLLASAGGNLLCLLVALLQGPGLATPFALACAPRRHVLWPLLAFAAIWVLGLLPFPHGYYNPRYLLPVLPIVGLCAALGSQRLPRAFARAVAVSALAGAAALTVAFDVGAVHARIAPFVPALALRGPRMPGLLDNLRLPLHEQARAWLGELDALPCGAVVYLLDFAYYGDAQHGVYERAGLIRGDLAIRYATRRGFAPAAGDFYACFWTAPDAQVLEPFGEVAKVHDDLFLVRRR